MVNSSMVAERIKTTCKARGIRLGIMLKDLGFGPNFVSQMPNTIEPSLYKISAIADYLNCSIDYLTGRTEFVSPEEELRSILKINTDQPLNDRKLEVFHLILQMPDNKVDAMIAYISANL